MGFILSSVFFLVLLCSLLWAGFDASRKKLTGYFDVLPLTFWLVFYISPLYILWMYLSWNGYPTSSEFWLLSALLLVSNTASNILFISSLSLGEISRVIPILSMTPVFSLIIAVLFFGESFASYEIAPILLVVSGLIVTNLDLRRGGEDYPVKAALFMLAVSFLWSLNINIDKRATILSSASFHASVQVIGVGISLFLLLKIRRTPFQFSKQKDHVKLLLLSVILFSSALAVQYSLLPSVNVGDFDTLKRAIAILASLVYGKIFFGERITKQKILGSSLTVGGIIWLSLSLVN